MMINVQPFGPEVKMSMSFRHTCFELNTTPKRTRLPSKTINALWPMKSTPAVSTCLGEDMNFILFIFILSRMRIRPISIDYTYYLN